MRGCRRLAGLLRRGCGQLRTTSRFCRVDTSETGTLTRPHFVAKKVLCIFRDSPYKEWWNKKTMVEIRFKDVMVFTPTTTCGWVWCVDKSANLSGTRWQIGHFFHNKSPFYKCEKSREEGWRCTLPSSLPVVSVLFTTTVRFSIGDLKHCASGRNPGCIPAMQPPFCCSIWKNTQGVSMRQKCPRRGESGRSSCVGRQLRYHDGWSQDTEATLVRLSMANVEILMQTEKQRDEKTSTFDKKVILIKRPHFSDVIIFAIVKTGKTHRRFLHAQPFQGLQRLPRFLCSRLHPFSMPRPAGVENRPTPSVNGRSMVGQWSQMGGSLSRRPQR